MDAGALANVLRRPVAVADDANPGRVAMNLRLAIAVVAAQGGRADLVRELQSLAGRFPMVRLVQASGSAARLEAGPHRFDVPATLRDALLAAAARPAAADRQAPRTHAAGTQHGRLADAAAGRSGRTPATLDAAALRALLLGPDVRRTAATAARRIDDGEAPRLRLAVEGALLDDTLDTAVAANRLQTAVRDSGLFAEAQLARRLRRGQEPSTGAAPREAPRAAGESTTIERTAAQLELLRRDAVLVSTIAWSGQPVRLDLVGERRDPAANVDPAAVPVFAATLRLELPSLGAVTVRLRLAGTTLAASVEGQDPAAWRAALPELAARLQARGLQPAALLARAVDGSDAPAV